MQFEETLDVQEIGLSSDETSAETTTALLNEDEPEEETESEEEMGEDEDEMDEEESETDEESEEDGEVEEG